MSFSEFGKIIEDAPAKAERGTFPEFGKEIDEISRARSLLGAFPKGAIKRFSDIAEFAQKVPLPKGEFNPQKAREFAEEKFPTLPRESEKFIERAGGVTTEALLNPGGILAKAIQIPIATGLGYLAEKADLPEWAQSLAEGLTFFYRGGKKIPLKPSQKKLGEFLRKEGLTENEITPLLKTPEQVNRWSTFASKGKKGRELMESIYHKTGKIYDSLVDQGKNLPPLSNQAKTKILNEFNEIKNQMPNVHWDLIKKDMADFLTKGRAGAEDLINLDRDINAVLGATRGAHDIVGRFKGPIKEALQSINPLLAEDYHLAKDLYKTRAKVKGALINPKDFDKFLDLGEAYALGQGIFNRDLGMMAKVIGISGARSLSREMLINPRLQNIATRIGEALKANKYVLAEKSLRSFNEILKKEDPQLSNQIDELFPK